MKIKGILIAVSLDKDDAQKLADDLRKSFPGVEFAIVYKKKSTDWNVYAAQTLYSPFPEEQIKLHAMNFYK